MTNLSAITIGLVGLTTAGKTTAILALSEEYEGLKEITRDINLDEGRTRCNVAYLFRFDGATDTGEKLFFLGSLFAGYCQEYETCSKCEVHN